MKLLINQNAIFMGIRKLRLKFQYLLLLFSICLNTNAQIIGFCATSPNVPNNIATIRTRALLSSTTDSYIIKVFFHVMRKSDGTGGQTQQEVTTAFNTLVSDYQPYNIRFVLLGTDEIKSDNQYNQTNFFADANGNTDLNGDGKFDVFSPNSHVNAIDIYLYANDKLNFGLAANIPGSALVIGGNSFNTNLDSSHVLSHEIGHCLGLFHTFHGTDRVHEPNGCAEFVDGSNGTTCGDFVQDTPADPSRIFDCGTQNTCTWNCSTTYIDAHGDHYNPDTHLFMAYTFPNCMNHHTAGQVARIFTSIENSVILQNVLDYEISGPTLICDQANYFVDGLLNGATVTWSNGYSSPPYPMLFQDNPVANQCTIKNTWKYPLTMTLTATIKLNGNIIATLTKQIASCDNSTIQTGTYSQLSCSCYGKLKSTTNGVLNGNSVWVNQCCPVNVKLDNMVGRTISYVPIGGIYDISSSWYYNSTTSTLTFTLPYGSANIPYQFNITNSSGCPNKSILFFSSATDQKATLSISQSSGSNQTILSLTSNITSDSNEINDWDVEIYNTSLPTNVYKEKKVKERKHAINTSSWDNGIYIVNAYVNNEVLTGKFIINH